MLDSPLQKLSLNKGMIATKIPTASPSRSTYGTSRSDGASRASCCGRPRQATFLTQKSTPAGSRTATGPSSDQLQCCPSCGELAGRQQEPHALHGPFYNSFTLFNLLKNEMGVHPIHFLSNYHDPRRASTVNRHVGDMPEQDDTKLPLAVQALYKVPCFGCVQCLYHHRFLQAPLSICL